MTWRNMSSGGTVPRILSLDGGGWSTTRPNHGTQEERGLGTHFSGICSRVQGRPRRRVPQNSPWSTVQLQPDSSLLQPSAQILYWPSYSFSPSFVVDYVSGNYVLYGMQIFFRLLQWFMLILPRRLTTLWVSAVCYRDSVTLKSNLIFVFVESLLWTLCFIVRK
jgi:hypothetical protein